MIGAYQGISARFKVLNMVSDIERGVVIAAVPKKVEKIVDLFSDMIPMG